MVVDGGWKGEKKRKRVRVLIMNMEAHEALLSTQMIIDKAVSLSASYALTKKTSVV